MQSIALFSDDTNLRDMLNQLDECKVSYFSLELDPDTLPNGITLAIFDFDVVPLSLLDEWEQFPRLHLRKMAVVSADNLNLVDDVLGRLDNYVARPFDIDRLQYRINQIIKPLPSDIIANMSFELRTPLTPLIGYNEILLHYYRSGEEFSVEEKIEFLSIALYSGKRVARNINFILDLIRIDQVRHYNFSIGKSDELIRWVRDYGDRELAKKSQMLKISPPQNSLNLLYDSSIYFVLKTIFDNASMYSLPNKGIECSISETDGYLLFSIRDNGCGIPESFTDKVFEIYKTDNSIAYQEGDDRLGINLYLSKQIIEMHGGEIWFENELGVGTTFYFTLPIAE